MSWTLLGGDDGVRSVLESENIAKDKLPATWFSVASVGLGPRGETDLIVQGLPPVAGGNVAPFWIFRGTPHGHELILVAYAHDLIARKKRFMGYRDIELDSMNASQISTVLLRFDGSKYNEYRSKVSPVR